MADNTAGLLTVQVKDLVAGGINNEALNEKVQEYIEISKFKIKVAKEILELGREAKKTVTYLDELEKDLALAEQDLNDSDKLTELLIGK